jgi:hypothetical protein
MLETTSNLVRVGLLSVAYRRRNHFAKKARNGKLAAKLLVCTAMVYGLSCSTQAQTFGCSQAMANDIVCENSKTGSPSSVWDISGAGDSTIQGFATDISVNQGGTVLFKINTNAKAYTITIFRVGYYGGAGGRQIATVSPSVPLPQTQPACKTDSTTFLYDCGNWAVSASWTVPSNATSGIYFARIVRTDTGGANHIVFIVRNDASHSDVLFQTADETWQAYNSYGGHSVYGQADTWDLPNRAYKVSYNRPFITRGFANESATWVFGSEYPMVRWLESNGYDVTYFTGVDAARSGSLIQNHKAYMDAGHDEYVSGPQRTSIEAGRDAGVDLAFFSGNEFFWKTRWESSIDGNNTAYRTMVVYKETLALDKIDPDDPPTWTGTWRDPSFSPPADGGRPENALTGTIFMVNGPASDNPGSLSIQVPAADGKMRFWRNTSIANLASGKTATLPAGTLGYEWDSDLDNWARPAGLFDLSTATYNMTADLLLDYGGIYGAGSVTHHMTMYRAPSGALVFGAGTVQWSWGLDSNHDNSFGFPTPPPSTDMQQATVNLFADMGIQPGSLQGGLLLATQSTDTTPPTSTITNPTAGSTVTTGSQVTITGTAADSGGGVVGGVEVSLDGGTTWHPASGRGSWTYTWVPDEIGTTTIRSRAVDDSGNLETPSPGVSLTTAARTCPCDVWTTSVTPQQIDGGDPSSTVLGVKFRVDSPGYITGIRFYKASTNTGTHIGSLWTSGGSLLGSATFTNETSSGWQQVSFSSPIAINANTTYIASYFAPKGHYSQDEKFFGTSGVDNPPIHLLAAGVDGPDGVYAYSTSNTFPISTYDSEYYWVDVLYSPNQGPTWSVSGTISPAASASGTTVTLSGAGSATVTASGSGVYSFTNLVNGTYTVTPTKSGYSFSPTSQLVTLNGANVTAVNFTAQVVAPPTCPCSVWNSSATPTMIDSADPAATDLGVKFRTDFNGYITALRFYKASTNTGTHIGNIWTSTGTLLGSVTFTNETGSGWQQMNFTNPIAVNANTSYVASYFAPNGHYSQDEAFFASSGVDNPPLHLLADGLDGPNGVYSYASSNTFPTLTYNTEYYWVDVVYTTNPGAIWSISGSISPALPGSGTVVTLSGTLSATATADGSGNYSFGGLANGSYAVTPSKAGLTFSPANQTVTLNGASASGVNFAVQTWTISGTVGVGSATVALSGTSTATAQADSLGNYTFSGLVNGNYTVTPTKSGYTFNPPGQAVTISGANSTANFTATPVPTYTVSGTISGAGGNGATLTLSGTASGTTTANSSGAYSFTGIGNGTYTLTPSNAGYTFSPTSASVTVSNGNATVAAFTAQSTSSSTIAIDVTASADSTKVATTIKSPTFSTKSANELLLAFISADYNSGASTTVTKITTTGLTWVLVLRTNTQSGTAEIWRAFSASTLSNATATATLSQSVFSSITVVSFSGVNTSGTNGSGAIGATNSANSNSGAPTATLTTTQNNSWIFGVGTDWDNPIARSVGPVQTMIHQDVSTSNGDTYWVQMQTSPTPLSGTSVTINDTAPTSDRYDLSIVEVLP